MIDKIISRFKSGISNNNVGMESAGKYIGIIERLLIFIFVLTGKFNVIGFIFTAKAIIRFPAAREELHFAEYFLVGTLTSFAYAVILSILTKYLLGYF